MTQGRKGFVVTVMLFLCLVLPGIILAGDRDADKNNKVSRQSMEGGSFNPRKGGDSMMDTQAINHPE
ncbi:MAG: hypothetical protein HW390_2543 [Candidatus Brocadiaceae bacterium]|nr:hypothetical protein [Candidatus Brocadiaceae bacterium]